MHGHGRETRSLKMRTYCVTYLTFRPPVLSLFFTMEGIHRWRLLWPILSVRGLSNARTPRCCWAFYGAGLRFASSARCPMTSPIGSGPGDTALIGANGQGPRAWHVIQRSSLPLGWPIPPRSSPWRLPFWRVSSPSRPPSRRASLTGSCQSGGQRRAPILPDSHHRGLQRHRSDLHLEQIPLGLNRRDSQALV